ncbi:MAG: hypothetical protein K8S23_11435 [Candidatus Cloacimonetes bacterium]|nr:hypothetical protein [Candidatus Cloacimonadota bacterium]
MKERIKNSIQKFELQDFYKSSLNFFNTLGYDSDKRVKLETPNFENFIEQFPPYAENKKNDNEKAFVSDWEEIQFLFQLTNEELKNS